MAGDVDIGHIVNEAPAGPSPSAEGATTVFLWEKDASPLGNDDEPGPVGAGETEQGQGDLSGIAFCDEGDF